MGASRAAVGSEDGMSLLTYPAPSRPLERVAPVAPVSLAHAAAALFASTCVVVGVLWDISWHSSIGRDTFWSAPHLAIYLGGLVAGLSSGASVLRASFRATQPRENEQLSFWWYFQGSLGDWLCIWGAIAMLASAPFDNWWHNAYGLDVRILSPPHAVLAMGILAIQLGSSFMVLALQNGAEGSPESAGSERAAIYRRMYAFAAGLIVINFAVMFTEYTFRIYQHSALFYQIVCATLLAPLVAAAVAGRMRWPATAAALTYTGVLLILHIVLPLFPAEPRLAPVLFPVDRLLPPQYPLLLLPPAVVTDLVLRRWRSAPPWALSVLLAAGFLGAFLAVQWPFADFLQSDYARNAIFKQNVRPYMIAEDSYGVRGEFFAPQAGLELWGGLAVALALGVVAARLGLGCGRWMSRVRR